MDAIELPVPVCYQVRRRNRRRISTAAVVRGPFGSSQRTSRTLVRRRLAYRDFLPQSQRARTAGRIVFRITRGALGLKPPWLPPIVIGDFGLPRLPNIRSGGRASSLRTAKFSDAIARKRGNRNSRRAPRFGIAVRYSRQRWVGSRNARASAAIEACGHCAWGKSRRDVWRSKLQGGDKLYVPIFRN